MHDGQECNGTNDGSKDCKAKTIITSLGEKIQFLRCDGRSESKVKCAGKVLKAKHHMIVTQSDGCYGCYGCYVGPIKTILASPSKWRRSAGGPTC